MNWAFGDSVGLNFSSINPAPDTNYVISSSEPSASISDANGNLLFYAGCPTYNVTWSFFKTTVWNRSHQIMPNGDSLTGYSSTTQGCMIIPDSYNSSRYYIFTIQRSPLGFTNLFYSIVDMTLENGMGDVDTNYRNIQINLGYTVSEKLNAVKHGNGKDWWVLAHKEDSDEFILLLVNAAGVSSPTFQTTGSYLTGKGTWGQMKFSEDGKWLCMVGKTSIADLFQFDRCSGALSNWNYLGDTLYNTTTESGNYGCSFSPNNQVLYISSWDSLFQYDLTASVIKNSKTLIFVGPCGDTCQLGQHQLAPNGRIYIANRKGFGINNYQFFPENMNINYIENPNTIGLGCNFNYLGQYLGGRRCFFGLPNLPNYDLGADSGSVCDTITGVWSTGYNLQSQKLNIYPNPSTDYLNIDGLKPGEKINYEILNSIGQKVKSGTVKNSSIKIKELNEGIYFINLNNEKGNWFKKFIKLCH